MLVNKKLDRFKQWAGERMGGEVKTNLSDDFKALEIEMGLRQEGMDKMHQTMTAYVKAISKRSDDRKEKVLPIAQLGGSMAQHAEDFEHDSQFGQCLGVFGRAQEKMARSQESYIVAASSSWLESLDKSLLQMKEYQASRRKLEQRRLAYDTSLAKMQKAKREDFRVEEELRSQKLKYEEAEEDVFRRMMDIKDAENESIDDLGAFMDAQLEYHEKCHQALLQMRDEWPATRQQPKSRNTRPTIRSRSNTVRSAVSTTSYNDELPALEIRTSNYSNRVASSRYMDSPVSDHGDNQSLRMRPSLGRSTTYDSRAEPRRDMSPVESPRLTRVPSDSLMLQNARSNLRGANGLQNERDVFADDSNLSTNNSDMSFADRSFSSTTSQGSAGAPISSMKKKPPPPPPSRATKPPPPAPPSKRTLIT